MWRAAILNHACWWQNIQENIWIYEDVIECFSYSTARGNDCQHVDEYSSSFHMMKKKIIPEVKVFKWQ